MENLKDLDLLIKKVNNAELQLDELLKSNNYYRYMYFKEIQSLKEKVVKLQHHLAEANVKVAMLENSMNTRIK